MFTVLIVDDEQWMLEMMERRLDEAEDDWHVLGKAHDGLEALPIIFEKRPDVVLADINMPHMDGIELLKKVREAGLNTLFIFLSGYDRFDYAQSAVNLGAFGYLLKPAAPEEIQAIMRKARQTLNFYWPERGQRKLDEIRKDGVQKGKSYYSELMQSVIRYIEKHYAEDINMESVARIYSFHPTYFSRLFSTHTGRHFSGYLTDMRMSKARELLRDGGHTVTEAALLSGYTDVKYFSKVFKNIVGESPSNYALKFMNR